MNFKSLALGTIVLFVFSLVQFPVEQAEKRPVLPTTASELGKLLFMDSILSEDYTLSCASCHIPEYAFADTSAVSLGVYGQKGTRNSPSAMNVLSRPIFFWDGRANSLEQQALMPIENPIEMNLPVDSAVARLQQSVFYSAAFQQVFNQAPSKETLASAIAEFERTLETGAPIDQFNAGDSSAISASAMRGMTIFNEKGRCFDCHFGPDMTGDEIRSIGTFDAIEFTDTGLFDITKDSADLGKFKVPTLRNTAVTGPYMHDGSFKTLREVIVYYNDPVAMRPHGINRDTSLAQPLGLTEQEMDDLEEFMKALTAPQFEHLLKD